MRIEWLIPSQQQRIQTVDKSANATVAMKELLMRLGWISSNKATLSPLTGGVSSEIYLVGENGSRFVVKRALEKLKVAADWRADTSRNDSEQAYMRYVGSFRPDAMPKIIASDITAGLFAMEYLDGFENWKAALLSGETDRDLAYRAGKLLGEIHARSWGDVEAMRSFDTLPNFEQLRVDPYLRAAAEKRPMLKEPILAEAERLMNSRVCLVHGDFSPKNILFRGARLVPLDCEVACYGDAAFDLGFFLNHFFLKGLYHRERGGPFVELSDAARRGYRNGNPEHADSVEQNAARLLPMLLLARVDGKSPVEYLDERQQTFVRDFVDRDKLVCNFDLDTLKQEWQLRLKGI